MLLIRKCINTLIVSRVLIVNFSKVSKLMKYDQTNRQKKNRQVELFTMKYTLIICGISLAFSSFYLLLELGKPEIGEDGLILKDEFSAMPDWKAHICRSFRELTYYKQLIKQPKSEKLLPDVIKEPQLQPTYTLVLELTNVLVHPDWSYKSGTRFKKRPGVDKFLDSLDGLYEIVVYTAEQGKTVFPIIEALDPKNIIAYKLVRDSTRSAGNHQVKNLDKLNRDLSKTIVVDCNPKSVKYHPNNVFCVPAWNGDDDDRMLADLAAFLKAIALSQIEDVRKVLAHYRAFDAPLDAFRNKQKRLVEQRETEREQNNLGDI